MTGPAPSIGILIHRLHEAGRYLDNVALNVRDQATSDVARAHANSVWDAALIVEGLWRMVRELPPELVASTSARES